MRNLGMRSTFQSLPLPIDSGGLSGRLKRLYSCGREQESETATTSCEAETYRAHRIWSITQDKTQMKTVKTADDASGSEMGHTEGHKNVLIGFIGPVCPLPPPGGWWKNSHHHSMGSCPCAEPSSHSQTWSRTECIPAWNNIEHLTLTQQQHHINLNMNMTPDELLLGRRKSLSSQVSSWYKQTTSSEITIQLEQRFSKTKTEGGFTTRLLC